MSEDRIKKREKFIIFLLASLFLAAIAICVVGFFIFHQFDGRLDDIKESQRKTEVNQLRTNQFLISSMDWSTRRQKLTLFMRDRIIDEWKRCGTDLDYHKAYDYSDFIVRYCENYPYVDPFLILAMQWKESSFQEDAVSHMGAIGLMQIMPYTARPYFELLGYTYSDDLLKKPSVNVRIGVRIVSHLIATYNNTGKVLGCYNAGPYGAYYYPDSLHRMQEETRLYIPAIENKFKEYKDGFKSFRIDSSMTYPEKK